MSLTAAQVGGIAFPEPAEGARGYHEDQVDTFMKEVAEEMARLEAENRALAEQLQHGDLAEHLHRLERERAEAQQRADNLRVELEKVRAVHELVDPSRLVEFAQRTAAQHTAEANRVASELLRKASTEAALLVSDAELRASTVVADARHAHAERIAGLVTRRRDALARIDALCQEARERRESLISQLGDRLRGMDPKPANRLPR
jgi:DivIVA domain-containing protein